ncbi:dynamin family protein [Streptomyces sp. NPDC048417]|uniref:dynamin family protein n=1 Tax=Streptomyces sp. NPDC048417 TaxID=3155387 RepID=UPI0034397757
MERKTVAGGAAGTWAPAVGEHLTWIRDVLGKLDLPAARRDKLWSALRAVQTRADDPELRIAVFGEASSGKSTLLNAFLRRRLLPSSARVTTTVTTVLRHHDGAEGLRLRTADGTELDWPSAAFDAWAGGPRTPSADGLEAALDRVLTTDLALRVRDLEVRSPVRPLGDGVAGQDTPGFSVTDPGHREMAEAAVRQADLAVVVGPAVAAMSMPLADFLTGPLLNHHDRCVFVVTKIDLVDEGERDDTAEFVADRLRSMGITDPLLLPCAPGKALPEADAAGGGTRPAVDHAGHLARFRAVEQRLVRLAAERRESAIAATVLTLLSQLLAAVELTADAQRAENRRAQRGLAALSLPDFPGFLDAWSRRVVDRVNTGTQYAATNAAAGSGRSGLDAKVVAAVADEKIDNIREAACEVSGIVGRHLKKEARKTARAAAGRAGELLAAGAGELARDFAAQYGALAGLAGETPAAPVVPVTGLDLQLRIDLTARRLTLTTRLREYVQSKRDGMIERLRWELDRTADPRGWWERDLPFRLRHELSVLAKESERTVLLPALTADSGWLDEEVAARLPGARPSWVPAAGGLKLSVEPEISGDVSNLSGVRLATRLGAQGGAIVGYLIAAARSAPLPMIYGAGFSLLGGLLVRM